MTEARARRLKEGLTRERQDEVCKACNDFEERQAKPEVTPPLVNEIDRKASILELAKMMENHPDVHPRARYVKLSG